MSKEVPSAERPQAGQVMAMTLLYGLAYLPMTTDLKAQVSLYIGFLLALRLASLRLPVLAPGRWLLLPLTLGGGANVIGAYHTFAGQNGGTALLATMLALKLLETQRTRDLRLATILLGFLLVSQFLFDQSPLRALYLTALLVFDFALMADLTARPEQGRAAVAFSLRVAGRLSLQALPLTLVLFVLFPRLEAPLWNLKRPMDKGLTGMSDWLEPGSLSELIISGEPAFRVRFEGPVPPDDSLYWRGPVTWHTDGRRWTRGREGTPQERSAQLARTEGEVAYRVDLESNSQKWLFALDVPVQVPRDARILDDLQVVTAKRSDGNRHYRVVSALRYDTGELTPDQELAGLQLPANETARMRRLVENWQARASGPREVVNQALRFFNEEPFHYTLLPPKLGANPTDEFLFETRRGFCEHYASSFALLMRIAGIPSRIVLGYMGGELNPIGDYLIVRQSDAHAWVEVWLEGRGWVRVDPTAWVAPWRVERSDLLDGLGSGAPMRFRIDNIGVLRRWVHDLRLLADALDTSWRDWVLGLSSDRQQKMMERIGLGFLREYGLALAMIIASAVVLAILGTALAREGGVRDPVERLYARFCRRLARIGLVRRRSEGPLNFSKRVTAARPDLRTPVEAFMSLYLPLRYDVNAMAGEGQRELERRLRRFRPRRRRSSGVRPAPRP